MLDRAWDLIGQAGHPRIARSVLARWESIFFVTSQPVCFTFLGGTIKAVGQLGNQHMNVRALLVEWAETLKRHKSGRLDSIGEALESGERWLKEVKLYSWSHAYYCGVAEAWECIAGAENVPPKTAKRAEEFMDRLITYENYIMDLKGHEETFSMIISPATVAKLAKAATGLDFTAYKEAYYLNCDDETKRWLAGYGNKKLNRSFETAFLPYVKDWVKIIGLAAKNKKGILVQMD